MRISSIIMAVVGLAVAGGSAQLAREMLTANQVDTAEEATDQIVRVVVSANEIGRGEVIQPYMLKTQEWPRDAVPQGAFLDMAALLPEAGGEPRRATRAMVAGEVVMNNKVSDFGEKVTIVQTLSADARAVAIKVDAVTSVGGFVTPGDFVDVLLTRSSEGNLVTDTILRNIRVIGVDQRADENSDTPVLAATVTVEATSQQSQILALGQRAGTLSLALRNPEAEDDQPIERLTLADLVPDVPKVEGAPQIEVRARPVVVVRRGVDAEEITLRN